MRMHIGFSFKPKFLLIVLVVILGIVGFCVDAFAVDVPEDVPDWALVPALEPGEDADRGYTTVYDMDGSILYTDDPALSVTANDTETPSNTLTLLRLPKLPRRRHTPTSAGSIPALLHLCKASSVTISPSWQQTAPVMSPPSPALPVWTSAGSAAVWRS